jgi:polyisoprenoid-binding protein YceI
MTWQIDPAHSSVQFSAKHMGLLTVRGSFTRFNGEVDLDEGDLTTATVKGTIEAASVNSGNEQRDTHLKSPDFLEVEKYPEITFRSTAVRREGDRYRMTGDLTIREVSRPVELDVELLGALNDPWGNRRLGLSASGAIDRKDWGLTWNGVIEAGGVIVSDRVKLEIEAELVGSLAAAEAESAAEAAVGSAA